MRVLVSPARLRRRGESGAVAVMVALLSVVLVGIGAFAIDFGMAYASTRQLQTASDAAALAAATVYRNTPGTCAALTANTTLVASAQQAADNIRTSNRSGSTRDSIAVSCINGDKALQVRYVSRGSTPSFLGGIFGRGDGYETTRPATALVTVPDKGIGVRPYAICGAQLPPLATLPTPVFKMQLPSAGNSMCPDAGSSGNWWSVDCPEAASNGTSDLASATLNGCADPITVVPNQVPAPPAPARTPSELRTYLEGYCPARNASCLSANPGNLSSEPIANAWATLVDRQEPILLPVFCGGAPSGPCDTSAVVNAGGNNAIYPVQSLIGVQVCGYHWSSAKEYDAGMTGECGANNPMGYRSHQGDNQDKYLLLRAVPVTVPGGTDDPSECGLGGACDTGLRQVFLTE